MEKNDIAKKENRKQRLLVEFSNISNLLLEMKTQIQNDPSNTKLGYLYPQYVNALLNITTILDKYKEEENIKNEIITEIINPFIEMFISEMKNVLEVNNMEKQEIDSIMKKIALRIKTNSEGLIHKVDDLFK